MPQANFRVKGAHRFIRLEDGDLLDRIEELTCLRIELPPRLADNYFGWRTVGAEDRMLVMETYADDFATFGYRPEGYP